MKNLNQIFVLISLFIISSLNSFSINYVSAGSGPAPWNVATSWTPNGIPGFNDNVTISAGHTINITGFQYCTDLIVNGTMQYTVNGTITVKGNYTVSASGNTASSVPYGGLQFSTSGKTVTINGSEGANIAWNFYGSYTIAGSSAIVKTGVTYVQAGITITNTGNFTMGGLSTAAGSGWINGSGSILTITQTGFFKTRTFTASAVPNTVNLNFPSDIVPLTTSGYYNLNVGGAGTKTLPSNTIISNNLTIGVSNTFKANSFDLSVGGNWLNNGIFTATAGKTVTFNGVTAQTVSNTLGTTTFKGLAINNLMGVTLTTGTYILDEVLTISNGTFNAAGRRFTMTSTAVQTARIAPITGSGAIAGNFTIQRFLTTRDTTWSDLSSTVQNTTFGDWANASELNFVYYSYSPSGSSPTQWTYDEPTDYFSPITSAATTLTAGKGYEVFLTGSYAYANFPNKTINTVGVPNQGDQNLNGLVSFTNQGTNLVGNPFASSISWSSVFAASSGLRNTYDMYDYLSGNYATFGLGSEIGSGQGFWVYATGAPSLQIPESAKTASSNSSIRSVIIEPYFTLKLSSNDVNNYYYHTLKINADNNSSDGWDDNDHPFHKSPNPLAPSINSVIEGKKSVINSFNLSNDSYSMPIQTSAGIAGHYKIEAAGFENIGEYSCIKLEDKLLNKTVDLNTQNSYSFEMNVGDNANRFIVHFSKNSDCRTAIVNNTTALLDNNILILPTSEGNSIEFMFAETTPVNITVTNILGQTVVDDLSLNVQSQTVNVTLPQDFSGMYIVKIESSKGVIIKKYVRK